MFQKVGLKVVWSRSQRMVGFLGQLLFLDCGRKIFEAWLYHKLSGVIKFNENQGGFIKGLGPYHQVINLAVVMKKTRM
jgi:hypothetical protein